jgi:DnaD/phage-associated family protein
MLGAIFQGKITFLKQRLRDCLQRGLLMPNRILKDSICTSPEIEQLTPEAEIFFYRLLVNCDDYGLFDARSAVLRSRLFPLRPMDDNYIHQLLSDVIRIGLVKIYEVEGRQYLEVIKWAKHQQIRAKRPKYPLPTGIYTHLQSSDIKCNHLITLAPVIQSNPIQSESNPCGITENEFSTSASFKAYENIGLMTPIISEKMKDAIKEYTEDWVVAAIEESVIQNKKSWGYIEAILKRWAVDGFKVDTRKVKGNGHNPSGNRQLPETYTDPDEYRKQYRLAHGMSATSNVTA